MSAHHCPTGYHTEPHYVCYGDHRCRCNGCRDAKVAYNARIRRQQQSAQRPEPTRSTAGQYVPPGHVLAVVPERAWTLIRSELARRGVTHDEWLDAVAAKIGRVA